MKRPVGWVYSTFLGLFLLIAGTGAIGTCLEAPPFKQRLILLTVPFALAAALLAHTLWGFQRFRQLPAGLSEEERIRAGRQLKKRMWILMLGAWVLLGAGQGLIGGIKSASDGPLNLQPKHLRLLGTRRLKGGEVAFDMELSVAHDTYERFSEASLVVVGTLDGAGLFSGDFKVDAPIPPGIRFVVKGSVPAEAKDGVLHVKVEAVLFNHWDRWKGFSHVQGSESHGGTVEADFPVELPP